MGSKAEQLTWAGVVKAWWPDPAQPFVSQIFPPEPLAKPKHPGTAGSRQFGFHRNRLGEPSQGMRIYLILASLGQGKAMPINELMQRVGLTRREIRSAVGDALGASVIVWKQSGEDVVLGIGPVIPDMPAVPEETAGSC